ncbi:MAG TPA: ADP-forming succinate--CoA ligase subunit beta [Bacilli bacterium]|nr:ADP-forming succinate--CoA ligase subunit beta [Bacilli bacterium]
MKIHEYQAKELFKAYGLPVPTGFVCETASQAKDAAKHYQTCVIKAQIHAGGRGKGGGIKLAKDPKHAYELATQIIGMNLVTKQTGPEGKRVKRVLVTETVKYTKEYYLSITPDYANAGLIIVASSEGGTEIEETAHDHPEKIIQIPVSLQSGLDDELTSKVAKALNIPVQLFEQLKSLLQGMIRLFIEKDCSLVEINPLVLTDNDHLLCLDAKISFDDNALFRHPDIKQLRDVDEEDPKEYWASQNDLSYVTLDGNIGCLVNGAGLAMATMDIIKHYGGQPANFLDVGGGASTERVKIAFEILLSDPNVKAIFINIFGGIMKCDVIANGVVSAAKSIGLNIPLVVRLEGTNVELGRQILSESGLAIISATDMADGATKVIEAVR